MHEIVAIGETMPGDVMERPFVTVPFAEWETLQAASEQLAALTGQLAAEKTRSAEIFDDYQSYMRQHQVLKGLQKAGN